MARAFGQRLAFERFAEKLLRRCDLVPYKQPTGTEEQGPNFVEIDLPKIPKA